MCEDSGLPERVREAETEPIDITTPGWYRVPGTKFRVRNVRTLQNGTWYFEVVENGEHSRGTR